MPRKYAVSNEGLSKIQQFKSLCDEAGLYYSTMSPGDGQTRYKLTTTDCDFHASSGVFVGSLAECRIFLNGWITSRVSNEKRFKLAELLEVLTCDVHDARTLTHNDKSIDALIDACEFVIHYKSHGE